MKTTKKTLSVFLAVFVLLSSLCFSASAEIIEGQCGDDARYTLDGGLLTIYGTGAIDGGAFYNNKSITKVVIGDGITAIGGLSDNQDVFGWCAKLSEITIPKSVETIGKNAFYYCQGLESVSMPNVKTIGEYAFYRCTELKSVSMPKVTDIGMYAFGYCNNLESVSMPGVTTIGARAFDTCSNLKSVSMPSVTTIGNLAFYKCGYLESVEMPSVTVIGMQAFYSCGNLESVTVSDKLESVGYMPFSGTNVQTVYFPCDSDENKIQEVMGRLKTGGVANASYQILPHTFEYTQNGSTHTGVCSGCGIEVTEPHTFEYTQDGSGSTYTGVCSVCGYTVTGLNRCGDNAYYTLDGNGLLNITGSGAIWDNAFKGRNDIKSVVMEYGITAIGTVNSSDGAFERCENLSEITIPDSVETIGGEAFHDCTSLESVNMPGVKTIGVASFGGCALKSLSMPNVTCINDGAFHECNSLTDVDMSSVEEIGYLAFNGCTSLKEVDMSAVQTILDAAFCNCYALKSITVSDKLETVGASAFSFYDSETQEISSGNITTVNFPCESNETKIEGVMDLLKAGGVPEGASYKIHTVVIDYAVEATCTESGLTEGSHCSVCDEVLQAQEEIPATGHTVVTDKAVKATCTESGLTEGSHCSVCDEVLQAQEEITALGHADADTNGYCDRDGCEKDLVIDGLGFELSSRIGLYFTTCEDLSDYMTEDNFIISRPDFTKKEPSRTIKWEKTENGFAFKDAAKDVTQEYTITYTGQNVLNGTPYDVKYERKFTPTDVLDNYTKEKYGEKCEALAQALKVYCEQAYAYFSKDTMIDASGRWDVVKEAIKDLGLQSIPTLPGSYYGTSLLLENQTKVRHYYNNGNKYSEFSVSPIYYSGADLDPKQYSVNDYIYKVLSVEGKDTDLKNLANLCVYLYDYGVAAKAYVTPTN